MRDTRLGDSGSRRVVPLCVWNLQPKRSFRCARTTRRVVPLCVWNLQPKRSFRCAHTTRRVVPLCVWNLQPKRSFRCAAHDSESRATMRLEPAAETQLQVCARLGESCHYASGTCSRNAASGVRARLGESCHYASGTCSRNAASGARTRLGESCHYASGTCSRSGTSGARARLGESCHYASGTCSRNAASGVRTTRRVVPRSAKPLLGWIADHRLAGSDPAQAHRSDPDRGAVTDGHSLQE